MNKSKLKPQRLKEVCGTCGFNLLGKIWLVGGKKVMTSWCDNKECTKW